MKKIKQYKSIFLLLILVVAGVIYYFSNKNEVDLVTESQTNTTAEKDVSEELGKRNEDVLPVTLNIFNALGSYYLATNTYPDEKNSDILSAIIFAFLEQNRYLSDGNNYVASCSKNENQIIQLACGGMTMGAIQVMDANQTLISFLRNLDVNDPKISQEVSYRMAENLSAQKEGYKNIYIYAPQIGYLYFKGADSDNPTGPIPYLITEEERKTLLSEIDSRFGDYIKQDEINYKQTGNHNAVLEAVKQIKSYITYDTYEQYNAAD